MELVCVCASQPDSLKLEVTIAVCFHKTVFGVQLEVFILSKIFNFILNFRTTDILCLLLYNFID